MKQFDRQSTSKGKENSRQPPTSDSGRSQEPANQPNEYLRASGRFSDFELQRRVRLTHVNLMQRLL
jgi:hypothetical protein